MVPLVLPLNNLDIVHYVYLSNIFFKSTFSKSDVVIFKIAPLPFVCGNLEQASNT